LVTVAFFLPGRAKELSAPFRTVRNSGGISVANGELPMNYDVNEPYSVLIFDLLGKQQVGDPHCSVPLTHCLGMRIQYCKQFAYQRHIDSAQKLQVALKQ
jgi:hypothetical protein